MDKELKDLKFSEFIENSGYYQTSMHSRYCRICRLPPKVKQKINQMILDGIDYGIIETYLLDQFPEVFKGIKHLKRTIDSHKKFLPFLIEDVKIKSIFKRARYIIENKDTNNISNSERVKIITEIENELIKEYSDIENERISLLNVLFKDTLPLMISRLQEEIVMGKPKDVKDLTDASNVLWKLTTAMATVDSIEKKEEKEEVDFSGLDEEPTVKGTKAKIVSLADNIKKATKANGII